MQECYVYRIKCLEIFQKDLFLFSNGANLINTIQVKMSRAYYNLNSKYQSMLWYNRFEPQDNADWFILVGIYAKFD